MEKKTKDYLIVGAVCAAALAATAWIAISPAAAADLGGDGVADLEERVAELEAIAARKGNRKVTLTIQGVVNTALLYADFGDYNNTTVVQNGNEESKVGFLVNARINNDLSAGATLEIAARDLGLLNLPASGTGLDVQQSNVWIKSEAVGKLTIGRAAQATKNFDEITTANTAVASKPLSLGALSDAYLTGFDVPFDGTFRDVVRYDSPTMAGFTLAATWSNSVDGTKLDGDGDTYDVALRYAGDLSGFKVVGGLGYRKSTDIELDLLHILSVSAATGDVDTFLAAGSVKHLDSGLFLTGNYADQDWKDAGLKLKGYALTGGIEHKWNSLGATTAYLEWNRFDFDNGGSAQVDMYGVGVVQAIDSVGMDLYISYRKYDLGDFSADDVTAATAGARIKF